MVRYFPARRDDWIKEKIAALTGFQKKVFDQQMAEGKEERRCLFLALSYPNDLLDPLVKKGISLSEEVLKNRKEEK